MPTSQADRLRQSEARYRATAAQEDRHRLDQATHLPLVQYAREIVRQTDGDRALDLSDSEILVRWGAIANFDDLDTRIQTAILGGFNAAADSLAGVYQESALPNHLAHQLATVTQPAAPLRVGRGSAAPELQLAIEAETWNLFRVGLNFEITEEDLLDSGTTFDVMTMVYREIGSSFRRVVLDALWGCLLSNPTLADGDAIFSVTRSNLGTAALASGPLRIGWGAIAGQVQQITPDATVYAHSNLRPSVLIVPPSLVVTAFQMMDGPPAGSAPLLEVRGESRLSSSGFLDPADDTIRSGNATNWLLAAKATEAPGIVLGTLGGKREPTVRSYALRSGRWGRGYDAWLALGVKAVSGSPFYWSTGTG